MKIADIKNNSIKIYRRYSLRKDTPQILNAVYIERKGNLADLEQRFGKDEIQKHLYLGNIKEIYGDIDTYKTTKDGIEMIKTFYCKQTPFQALKSILFGILSIPFVKRN